MRILVLSSEHLQTGSSVRGFGVACALRRIGHEVDFLSTGEYLPLRLDRVLALPKWLTKVSQGYDVVVSIKPYANASVPALIASARSDRSDCMSVIDVDDLDHAYRAGLLSLGIKAAQLPFLRFADLITCHTESLRRYLTADLGIERDDVYRLEQGVDPAIFDQSLWQSAPGQTVRGAAESGPVLNVCHFDVAADLGELLQAFAMAIRLDPGMRFVMVGGGPMLGRCKGLAQEMGLTPFVSFEGPQPPSEVARRILTAGTCTVYYGDREPNRYRSSLKLREYLWMGKKVVSTNVGELADFAPYTYQSPPAPEDFAQRLVEVASIGESRRARRGRRFVRSRFSWTRIARDFSKVLEARMG